MFPLFRPLFQSMAKVFSGAEGLTAVVGCFGILLLLAGCWAFSALIALLIYTHIVLMLAPGLPHFGFLAMLGIIFALTWVTGLFRGGK